MFTKKHYKAIAEIIDSTKLTQEDFVNPYDERAQGVADGINIMRQEIGDKLADYFANDYPAKIPKNCFCGESYLQDKGNKIVCTNCGGSIFKFDRQKFVKACSID